MLIRSLWAPIHCMSDVKTPPPQRFIEAMPLIANRPTLMRLAQRERLLRVNRETRRRSSRSGGGARLYAL